MEQIHGVGGISQSVAGEHKKDPNHKPGQDDDGLISGELFHDSSFLAQPQLPQDPIGAVTEKQAAGRADQDQDQEYEDDPFRFSQKGPGW